MSDLSRYRWHTGAKLRRLAPEERVPPLFRDVGPVALAAYLRGEMTRLAGPMTPLTYLRSWRWPEPYVDHAGTGRLVVLDGRALGAWHAGVPHVFVAPARRFPATLGYVPGDLPLEDAARCLADARDADELREALGGRTHDERRRHDLAALDALERARARADTVLEPIRRALQQGDDDARRQMEALGADEVDLCAAWHHLPAARREALVALTTEVP